MQLEYYENPGYIFVSWNEESGGEYTLSPFGYVPEKGMTEYYVTSDKVEFILSNFKMTMMLQLLCLMQHRRRLLPDLVHLRRKL